MPARRFKRKWGWEGPAAAALAVSVLAAGYSMIGDLQKDRTAEWTEHAVGRWFDHADTRERALFTLARYAGDLDAKRAECWFAMVDEFRVRGAENPERRAAEALVEIWEFRLDGGQVLVGACDKLVEAALYAGQLREAERRARQEEVHQLRQRVDQRVRDWELSQAEQ
jgi:hypothetical protein